MTETGLPVGRIPVLRLPAVPSHANKNGNIFGGWLMSQVDIAGSIPAEIAAKGPLVTRAVDSFEFNKPVLVGDLVNCYAEVVEVGRTSIRVKVEVYAQRFRGESITAVKVTEAFLVYVAVNEHGKPRQID